MEQQPGAPANIGKPFHVERRSEPLGLGAASREAEA